VVQAAVAGETGFTLHRQPLDHPGWQLQRRIEDRQVAEQAAASAEWRRAGVQGKNMGQLMGQDQVEP